MPEDTVTLVRINGIAQVLGGAALATGKGRRLGALLLAGSLVPSTIAKHPFWTVQDPEERAQDRTHFLKNVSLLGGVLVAAQDTEGKPSLAWRAQKGGEVLAKDARKASKKLTKSTSRVAGECRRAGGHRRRHRCGIGRGRGQILAEGAEAGSEAAEGGEGAGSQAG